jgi:hypothetical protein
MATSLRQQANSEQPWLGNARPSPLLRLDAHTRGCMYQRRGENVRAITEFAKTAIHSLQRCIRRRKPPDARKIERSLSSSARVALHHGLRIDPLAHTHKDFS